MATTYHIVPREVWDGLGEGQDYAPDSLREEGFIHTTAGMSNMADTANKHYKDDPRPYYILTVDLDKLTSAWRYDDPQRIYPHIYGPLNREAVAAVREMPRAADGSFVGLGELATLKFYAIAIPVAGGLWYNTSERNAGP